MTLRICLLGAFALEQNGEPVYAVQRARLQALLAYLLLHRHAPLLRQRVAFALWPDSSEAQARSNLRRNLHDLRQALSQIDQHLHAEDQTLHWRATHPDACQLDVARFEELLAQASTPHSPTHERNLLEEAVALYRGDLLPGCYDDWILPQRERLRQGYCQALERLMTLAEDAGEYAGAIATAQRLLRTDPLRESTYRRLMRYHAFRGDRASALEVYHTCAAQLQQEMGVEPGPETQAAYARLLGAQRPRRLRPGAPAQPHRTQLVGRAREWYALLDAWDAVSGDAVAEGGAGGVHLCLIRGEAGIGKSRLAQELLDWAQEHGASAAHTRAYQAAGTLAYSPLINWLRTPPLQEALAALDDVWLAEISRLLPELLTERPHLPPPQPLQESWQRQRFFGALALAFCACPQPLLLVLDDVQWCDGETLEWLRFLLETPRQGAAAPSILVVCTARPEEVDDSHPLMALLRALPGHARLTELDLPPLDREQSGQLAAQMQGTALDLPQTADLFDYTGGNPLFLVETLAMEGWQAEIGSSLGDLGLPTFPQQASLPPRLYAVIQSRLVQLSTAARQLASVAAVIGRAFSYALLRQASGLEEDAAIAGLDELWQRGILQAQTGSRYDFSHDRIRDVAYAEISPVQRPLLHRRVAQALEARHAGELDSISGQLGLHYEKAGEHAGALLYYEKAAATAADLFAQEEVLFYTERALAVLREKPDSDETKRRRIDILMRKERALVCVYGEARAERRELLELAYTLAAGLDDALRRFRVLEQMSAYYGWFGNRKRKAELASEISALAQAIGEPEILNFAHWDMGELYYGQGKFAAALEQLQLPVVVEDTDEDKIRDALSLSSTSFLKSIVQAHLIWLIGYPDRSRSEALKTVRTVDQRGQIFDQIKIYSYFSLLLQCLGDRQALREALTGMKERCQVFSHQDSMLEISIMEGWLLVEEESSLAGLAQITETLREMQESGTRVYHHYLLALAQKSLDKANDALETLREAYEISLKQDDYRWLAEIHRLTGEVRQGLAHPPAEVEGCFQEALAVSRQQGAKSLELRAATSLARFWQGQGKTPQAHQLLSGIYGWFTEGFDTPDLQAARALLAELT